MSGSRNENGCNDNVDVQRATFFVILQLLLHGLGAMFYATKLPEKSFNFRITNYVNSHVIFHVFIVAGFASFNHAIEILYKEYYYIEKVICVDVQI